MLIKCFILDPQWLLDLSFWAKWLHRATELAHHHWLHQYMYFSVTSHSFKLSTIWYFYSYLTDVYLLKHLCKEFIILWYFFFEIPVWVGCQFLSLWLCLGCVLFSVTFTFKAIKSGLVATTHKSLSLCARIVFICTGGRFAHSLCNSSPPAPA